MMAILIGIIYFQTNLLSELKWRIECLEYANVTKDNFVADYKNKVCGHRSFYDYVFNSS